MVFVLWLLVCFRFCSLLIKPFVACHQITVFIRHTAFFLNSAQSKFLKQEPAEMG